LLTQCPNCETTFRVTAEILRVADGQVRCGRCHTQFDALERLIEEGDPNAAESGRFLSTPPRPDPRRGLQSGPRQDPLPGPIEVEEPDSMEEITLEGKRIEISGTYRVVDAEGHGEPQVRQETVEEWVEIDDEPTEDVASNVEADDAEADDRDPAASDRAHSPRPTRAPLGSRLAREPEESAVDELPPFVVARPKRTPLVWKILVLPLALLLIAQIVHHHRAELARHPRLGAPLMNAYRALGLHLTPDWDLHAYGVKQWGVVMDPTAPGTLKVRASITNNAAFAQPYPLLKLMLEDRWGDQVRAREFEPAEYLDPGVAPDRLLGPAQQTNATISIVDPGPDAEGFRFDVCLRGKAGAVCAADVPAPSH
jgi:predicted Zn finger-like uncharacterized protein